MKNKILTSSLAIFIYNIAFTAAFENVPNPLQVPRTPQRPALTAEQLAERAQRWQQREQERAQAGRPLLARRLFPAQQ